MAITGRSLSRATAAEEPKWTQREARQLARMYNLDRPTPPNHTWVAHPVPEDGGGGAASHWAVSLRPST